MDSEAEQRAEELFSSQKINTSADFEREVLAVFNEVCGNIGQSEFVEYVLPRLSQVYGSNYRKAGARALELIDKGADLPASKIADYFKNALSIELSKAKKQPLTLSKIETTLNALLRELETESKREYHDSYNVCGAIAYGSFVKGEAHPESDLDVILLTRNGKEDLCEDFQRKAEAKLRLQLDVFDVPVRYDDREELTREVFGDTPVQGNYRVISPFRNIRDTVNSILESHKAQSA